MTTYTKATIITFQNTVDLLDPNFLTPWFQKVVELTQQGKTDGSYEFLDEHRTVRFWLDQAAAQEWVDYCIAYSQAGGVVITSTEIVDNTFTP